MWSASGRAIRDPSRSFTDSISRQHRERGAQGASRVVFVRVRRTEDREDRVADLLLEPAVSERDLIEEVAEAFVEQ
jgi:hypothetical protein